MNQGRITEAELQFRQSIRTNPRNAQAHNNLGAALATQRKYSEAIVEFKKALEIDDSYKSAKDNLYRANNALSGEKVDQK
jgi:Tfp pilus assembly protein PilF